jgi:four helix bundle protein
MAAITRFEEIRAWQTARELTNLIYDVSGQKAFARDFGLRDQIRRASVSVMSNIAEGFESRTQALFIDFLGRAKASAGEVRAQLYVALDREYVSQAHFDQAYELADRAARQIYGFMRYLETQRDVRRVREGHVEYDVTVEG